MGKNSRLFKPKLLPGFGLSLGITLFYLSVIVLIPLSMLFFKTTSLTWTQYLEIISSDRVIAAFRVSFISAFVAAAVNAFFGLIIAWVQVRYNYPGKRVVDAIIDLPFALPTSVAGIALTATFGASGWIGRLAESWGIHIVYTQLGIIVALMFIGVPFVVRTLEPVLMEMGADLEEAAKSLGATRWQVFTEVIFPLLLPATITGAAMAFARGLGEYGSVVFISGNMPFKTEIVPLLIVSKLEQFDYPAATAIAVTMLGLSFLGLFGINLLHHWQRRRLGSS